MLKYIVFCRGRPAALNLMALPPKLGMNDGWLAFTKSGNDIIH